jgi:hypothetical protein
MAVGAGSPQVRTEAGGAAIQRRGPHPQKAECYLAPCGNGGETPPLFRRQQRSPPHGGQRPEDSNGPCRTADSGPAAHTASPLRDLGLCAQIQSPGHPKRLSQPRGGAARSRAGLSGIAGGYGLVMSTNGVFFSTNWPFKAAVAPELKTPRQFTAEPNFSRSPSWLTLSVPVVLL